MDTLNSLSRSRVAVFEERLYVSHCWGPMAAGCTGVCAWPRRVFGIHGLPLHGKIYFLGLASAFDGIRFQIWYMMSSVREQAGVQTGAQVSFTEWVAVCQSAGTLH